MATFNGTNSADILNGTNFGDLILGNGGNDILRGHGGNDQIRAGSGDDIVEGGAGDDWLFADSGSNSLFGGSGSDILVSGSGSDLLSGGSGIDLASWETSSLGVNANLATGRAITISTIDSLIGIENLLGSRFNDVLSGDGGANTLYGGAGDDLLMGGGGNDTLFGGSGNDSLDGGSGLGNSLDGGSGVDTVTFTGAAFADVDLGRGTAWSSLGASSLTGIENVRGTNGGDTILGDAGASRIEGLGGADRINGGAGDDVLIGGSGADTFVLEAFKVLPFGVPGYDSGHDTIADFGLNDRIDLTLHFEATTFDELKARASQFGDDTVLRLGDDSIRIEDFSLRELATELFLF
jgi:Ca2+-binding RTX toxin-like protein